MFTKKTFKHTLHLAALIIIAVTLNSCGATGSYILVGNTRTPVSAAEVKLYLDAPQQFETIGVVEAVNTVGMSRQQAQNQVVDKLKEEAGRLGANGLLLTNTGSQTLISPPSGESQSNSKSRELTAQGRAIFVIKE